MGWTGSHMTSSVSADLFVRTRTELLSKLNLLASSSSLDEGSTNMICSGGEERVVSHTCTHPLRCVASFFESSFNPTADDLSLKYGWYYISK